TDAHEGEDGPIYIDDISVRQGPDEGNTTPVFSEDFEALVAGNLPGQAGWVSDNVLPGGVSPTLLVDDPAASGQGLVARIDAAGNDGGWQGVFHDFADTTEDVVIISWKQYRADLTDDVWAYFGNAANDLSGGWLFGWDSSTPSPAYFPYHFAGDASAMAPQATGLWQTVTVTYRALTTPNPAFRDIFVSIEDPVNGLITGVPVTQDLGFNATDSIRGFGLDLEGTSTISGGAPNPLVAEWVSDVCSDDGFPLRGGPLVGPDGKAYYASPANNTLYAIRAVEILPTLGDMNCDGSVDIDDFDPFALALTDPDGYLAEFEDCDIESADISGDNLRDGRDVQAFVGLLLGE
ncbi:MAG TPA: hypothetical protein VNT79_03605, partial [Phycisphaerae bacterium]|nr:hypothetical protein [Phycisphaerae bacterium]